MSCVGMQTVGYVTFVCVWGNPEGQKVEVLPMALCDLRETLSEETEAGT